MGRQQTDDYHRRRRTTRQCVRRHSLQCAHGQATSGRRHAERILRAIEDLGYQPNLLARSLVNRASNTIGVVTSGLEFYGPSCTLVGIEQQANDLGYSLLLDLLHDPEAEDVDTVLDDLISLARGRHYLGST